MQHFLHNSRLNQICGPSDIAGNALISYTRCANLSIASAVVVGPEIFHNKEFLGVINQLKLVKLFTVGNVNKYELFEYTCIPLAHLKTARFLLFG